MVRKGRRETGRLMLVSWKTPRRIKTKTRGIPADWRSEGEENKVLATVNSKYQNKICHQPPGLNLINNHNTATPAINGAVPIKVKRKGSVWAIWAEPRVRWPSLNSGFKLSAPVLT